MRRTIYAITALMILSLMCMPQIQGFWKYNSLNQILTLIKIKKFIKVVNYKEKLKTLESYKLDAVEAEKTLFELQIQDTLLKIQKNERIIARIDKKFEKFKNEQGTEKTL